MPAYVADFTTFVDGAFVRARRVALAAETADEAMEEMGALPSPAGAHTSFLAEVTPEEWAEALAAATATPPPGARPGCNFCGLVAQPDVILFRGPDVAICQNCLELSLGAFALTDPPGFERMVERAQAIAREHREASSDSETL